MRSPDEFDEFGRCLPDNCLNFSGLDCVNCAQKYYINVNNSCSKLPPNCETANILGNCIKCIPGFTLLDNGVCLRTITNCVELNFGTELCIRCKDGYYVNIIGHCSLLPDNCISANPSGECITCIAGFVPVEGLCIRDVANCEKLDAAVNGCVKCKEGYYVTLDRKCNLLPANCR